jgi:hypothetical protein
MNIHLRYAAAVLHTLAKLWAWHNPATNNQQHLDATQVATSDARAVYRVCLRLIHLGMFETGTNTAHVHRVVHLRDFSVRK